YSAKGSTQSAPRLAAAAGGGAGASLTRSPGSASVAGAASCDWPALESTRVPDRFRFGVRARPRTGAAALPRVLPTGAAEVFAAGAATIVALSAGAAGTAGAAAGAITSRVSAGAIDGVAG